MENFPLPPYRFEAKHSFVLGEMVLGYDYRKIDTGTQALALGTSLSISILYYFILTHRISEGNTVLFGVQNVLYCSHLTAILVTSKI